MIGPAGAAITLTRIRRYPVKSCRGHDLDVGVVEPWGLAGDRRWMLVDAEGVVVTARTRPQLVLVVAEPDGEGLLLRAPGMPELRVAPPGRDVHLDVRVWSSVVPAAPASAAVHSWFAEVLGEPVRLVHLDDPTVRATDPDHGLPDDRVSFADAFPLLLTSADSLADLVALMGDDAPDAGPAPGGSALDMVRFRPNVVVAGAPAWAEDRWRWIRIGDAVFRVVKGCSRCVLTTVDPATAQRGREPLRTLARSRRWDGGLWFGVNLVPDAPYTAIRVGDPVEVLETAAEPG